MSYSKLTYERLRIDRFTANRYLDSQPDAAGHKIAICAHSMEGNLLPNWRKIISSGGNATTVFSGYENTIQVDYVDMSYSLYWASAFEPWKWVHYRGRDNSFANWFNLDPFAEFTAIPGLVSKARDRAIKALYQELWKAHHQVQGGVVLGELGKTAKMMAGTAGNLRRGVFDYISKAVGIRKGKGSQKSRRKAIADSYLEAVFGWQPLIMDCKDLAKTLGRLIHESDRVRFRAFGVEAKQVAQAASTVSFGGMFVNQTTIDTAEVKAIYRGFLQGPKYEAGSPPLERIVSMSGFDLRSFVPTVWELIPYSFLVDYFTNIGDALQALMTDTSGVTGLWYTEIKESQRDINLSPDLERSKAQILHDYSGAGEKVADLNVSGKSGGFTQKTRTVNRSPSGVPLLLPRFTGVEDISVKQFINIGALLMSKTG